MAALTDAELYRRGAATLVATWEAYADGTPGAALIRAPGVSIGVFPAGPERAVYNNALLERGLGPAARAEALDALAAAYAAAGIADFAAWAHESDTALRADLEARGYAAVEATRAMAMALAGLRAPPLALDLAPPDWADYLRVIEVPGDLLTGVDRRRFHVLVARHGGERVVAGMAFDHGGDCGIYNVGTLAPWRRRGLGAALTARLAGDAGARGCTTASLQSTPMAERVYASLGFRDLGRFIEYG